MPLRKKLPTKALINICRVNTSNFRKLTTRQLERATLNFLYLNNWRPATTRPTATDAIVWGFIKSLARLSGRREGQSYGYGRAPIHQLENKASKLELAIWNAQTKAGCKISHVEEVARDAARKGDFTVATKVRNRR